MKVLIFVYSAFVLRLTILFISSWYGVERFRRIHLKESMSKKDHVAFLCKALQSIFLWPLDFYQIPRIFLKALFTFDSQSCFNLWYYYGKK